MTWVLVCRRPEGPFYARAVRPYGEDYPYTFTLAFAQEFSTEQAALAHRIEHPSDGYKLVSAGRWFAAPLADEMLSAGPWVAVPLADELLEREARRR